MTGENKVLYNYLDKNVPNSKINYSFSKYLGECFIKIWKDSRKEVLDKYKLDKGINSDKVLGTLQYGKIGVYDTLTLIKTWCSNKKELVKFFPKINLLLKRFEVTKKIFNKYDIDFYPINRDDYKNFTCYCGFGYLLVCCYEVSGKLQYLNSLLKLNDILCSVSDKLSKKNLQTLVFLIKKERLFINDLIDKKL